MNTPVTGNGRLRRASAIVPGVSDRARDARAGLCSLCRHSRTIESARGSTFWLCTRAATDPRFRKYPPLPVLQCPGFERDGPEPTG